MIARVLALALNTFREAVRDRILYLLLVVGLAAVAFSHFLGEISVGDSLHVIADTGLTAVSLLGVMISVFVGTGLIYKEIDKRTVYTILSKPVRRGEFILGKYLGLVLTVMTCMALLSVGFLVYFRVMAGAVELAPGQEPASKIGKLVFFLHGGRITWPLAAALLFSMIEVALIISVAVMFSSASTPILSAVLTTVVFAAGRLSHWIPDFMDHLGQTRTGGSAAQFVLQLLYYLTPNLGLFDLRSAAVDAPADLPSAGDLGRIALYAAGYAAAMLLGATLIFRRRRF
jgi:ABC-type transport system involved in multi-copper enzyme maturation permease subunit